MDKIHEIAKVLSITSNEKLILHFFKSILTPNEVRDISSRWELVKLLDQGYTQRDIAKKLNLSLCKITRGSKEISKKKSPFKEFIDKFNNIKTGGQN